MKDHQKFRWSNFAKKRMTFQKIHSSFHPLLADDGTRNLSYLHVPNIRGKFSKAPFTRIISMPAHCSTLSTHEPQPHSAPGNKSSFSSFIHSATLSFPLPSTLASPLNIPYSFLPSSSSLLTRRVPSSLPSFFFLYQRAPPPQASRAFWTRVARDKNLLIRRGCNNNKGLSFIRER